MIRKHENMLVLAALTLFALAGLDLLSLMAQAPAPTLDSPYRIGSFTTLSTNQVAASTTATVTSDAVPLAPGKGIGIWPTFVTDGASTGNVTFQFGLSRDGTTWTTTAPITATVPATGTTSVRGFVNLSPYASTSLNNARYLRLQSINNAATNVLTVTSIHWTIGKD
jgi:hypothetical protein